MISIPRDEHPQPESTAFVRPKKKDWRVGRIIILVLVGIVLIIGVFTLRPMMIEDETMVPTYPAKTFMVRFLPYFKLFKPHRKQTVIIAYPENNAFFIRRILAIPGETVEIRRGTLYINGKPLNEPYVGECRWVLPRTKVPRGKVFVLGDNRSMPMQNHTKSGMIDQSRIAGVPLW